MYRSFFLNDPPTTEIYTLSLHDALPIYPSTMAVLPTPGSPIRTGLFFVRRERTWITRRISSSRPITGSSFPDSAAAVRDRKSTRLNSSHGYISYAVFCLKKKKKKTTELQ